MDFHHLVGQQLDIQRTTYGHDPAGMTPDERSSYVTWNILAATDELHEALGEVGWKPWASSRHMNVQAFKGELVDAFIFLLNLWLAGGGTPDEFITMVNQKQLKNMARQAEGYDGVTGKCSVCRRALDDEAVTCTEGQCTQ